MINRRNQETTACEPNPACCLILQIKFYWNTAASFHLHIVSGCFHATTAELSSCNRKEQQQKPDSPHRKKYLLSGVLRKSLPASNLLLLSSFKSHLFFILVYF